MHHHIHSTVHPRRRRDGLSPRWALAALCIAAGAARANDPPSAALYAYGSGTEWVVDTSGALLQKARVMVQVELDESVGLIRETITPLKPGYARAIPRVLVLTVKSVRRTNGETTWVASAADGDITRHVTTVASSERIWSYEVWTDKHGKLLLYRVRDASVVNARDFADAPRQHVSALDELSR